MNKCQQQKFKKCQWGEQNLIYLTNWLFSHPPNVTNFNNSNTKMLIIKPPPPPPFDDEQQRQQCTCLNAISYTKQITTSYSFSKPPTSQQHVWKAAATRWCIRRNTPIGIFSPLQWTIRTINRPTKICRPRWTKLNILGDDIKNPLSKNLLGYDQKWLHTNCSRTKEQSYNRQRHPRRMSTEVHTALKATGWSCIVEAKIKQIIKPLSTCSTMLCWTIDKVTTTSTTASFLIIPKTLPG